MFAARTDHSKTTALALVACLAAAFFLPSEVRAAAGGIYNCTVGLTCTIGEYLYDDSSSSINNATCTIVSWYPDDTSFLNTSMDIPTQSDGWYSKSFTAPATTGFYRTTVSCTVSGDTLSIDKSFEVVAAAEAPASSNDIAGAVWGYSTRTLSSFGDLITNIWNSATRTLTGADLTSGKLASQSDVTAVSDKVGTISSTTTNVTNVTNNVSEIKNVTEQTRLLLEQVVNKPIIENVLEETTLDVGEKIKSTRAMANQLYVNNQFLTSQSAALVSKWNGASGKEILDSVIALSNVLGDSSDASTATTMFGQANWIADSWNWDEAVSLKNQLVLTGKLMENLKQSLADYQKTPALLGDAKALVKSSLALEKIVGTAGETTGKKTLFAKIGSTQTLAKSLEDKNGQIDKALGTKSPANVSSLKNQVLALNKVPGAMGALSKASPSDAKSIRNLLLGLKGIISSNLKLLALGSGKMLVNVWLEEGSMVFKTLVTNPSTLVSQEVEVKYYLPSELKEEDIIEKDAGLEVKYDAEKNQLYVSGNFTLAAGATRTFSVRTNDVWALSGSEIESLRSQTEALFSPLEKTAYFAQGVSLKSDINAALDRMNDLTAQAVTPEQKIKAYREAEILKKSVEEKLAGMKELVTQASAAGSLFGFVGGAQTIGVWGLITVIAAGFIFMTIYMKTMIGRNGNGLEGASKGEKSLRPHSFNPVRFVAVMFVSSAVSATIAGVTVGRIVSRKYEEKLAILGAKIEAPAVPYRPEPTQEPEAKEPDLGVGGVYLVVIGETPTGFLRVRETPRGMEIAKVKPGDRLIYLDENEEWFNVELEDGTSGWVSKEYSSKE